MSLTKATFSMIEGAVVNVLDYISIAEHADIFSRTSTFDCTSAIQDAIDANSRGVVYFPAGLYNCTGVTARDFLTLKGDGPGASIIKFTPSTGSCITLPVNCTNFHMDSMTLAGPSSFNTYGINGTNEYVSTFKCTNFTIQNFWIGCYIQQGLNITFDIGYVQGYGGSVGPIVPPSNGSIGIKLGDNILVKGCTTVTIKDVYVTQTQTDIYTLASPCTILRCVFEWTQIGIDIYGRATVINPFFSECTVAANMTSNGALFIGPYATEYNFTYASSSEQARTSFIPDTADTSLKIGPQSWSAASGVTTFTSGLASAKNTITESTDTNALVVNATNASFSSVGAIRANISRDTSTNQYEVFVYYNAGASEVRWQVEDSGTVKNKTGTYGALSDANLKQDISDAASQWNDVKALRVRKYRFKNDVQKDSNSPLMLGLVAQEVEQISPGLVEQNNFDGKTIKGVKQSIVYMKALKALQEAMERIEKLEQQVQKTF